MLKSRSGWKLVHLTIAFLLAFVMIAEAFPSFERGTTGPEDHNKLHLLRDVNSSMSVDCAPPSVLRDQIRESRITKPYQASIASNVRIAAPLNKIALASKRNIAFRDRDVLDRDLKEILSAAALAPPATFQNPSGTDAIVSTHNVFEAASLRPSLSRQPHLGVFSQNWNSTSKHQARFVKPPDTRIALKASASDVGEAISGLPDSSVAITTGSVTQESSEINRDNVLVNETNPLAASLGSVSQTSGASKQNRQEAKVSEKKDTATVKAEGRGAPFINYKDGKELEITRRETDANTTMGTTGEATLLSSADFDSDGVPDLVTADSNGILHFYRGNLDSIMPNGARARKHKEEGTFVDSPFFPTEKSFALGLTPDFLLVGDFNADGKKDVLTAAKGDNRLQLLAGDGHGNFAAPVTTLLPGKVIVLTVGEIGRPDGQTDIVVAVQNEKSSLLLVFEHPEGAFKHKPEVFTLPSPASDIAIGNLDEDFYSDVAVACGDQLVIVQGRGQAYPWDLLPEVGVKRPTAAVASRKMSFAISALAIGRFGQKRGQSLALLGADGNIYHLEPNRKQAASNNKLPATTLSQTKPLPFVPTDAEPRALATVETSHPTSSNTDAFGMPKIDVNAARGRNFQEYLRNLLEQAAKDAPKPDKQAVAKVMADGAQQKAELTERAKTSFLRSLAAKPSTLGSWEMETLVSSSRFAGATASGGRGQKLQRVNVSTSNLDDLMIIDSGANQIHLAAKTSQAASSQFDVASFDVEGDVQAVLPMRLNIDALSDLVVLMKGATAPSFVISAPTNDFTVNSTTDFGDCIGSNPCSLRNAILLANSSPGAGFIVFDFGGAVTTITPASELPAITKAVTMFGPTDDNNHPMIELSGANVPTPADGIKVRGSNITVQSLAINRFQSIASGSSQIGGNGLTIESNSSSPNNGNNFVFNNFLGTDPGGTLDRGNSATGLNIFDSDNNFIGGSFFGGGNVISGNGNSTGGGVGISVTAGNANNFQGNIIGLNAAGNAKLGNSLGLFFSGANNFFGGPGSGDGNTVSGNGTPDPNSPGRCILIGNGIFSAAMFFATLVDQNTNELLTLNNNIAGNFFGTNPGGTLPLGNCYAAIWTSPLHQTTIGSIVREGRNIVSDNGFEAIACNEEVFTQSEGGFCAIAGNNIGTDVTGTIAIPNDFRNYAGGLDRTRGIVEILHNISYSYFGAPGGTTAGGACAGFCNLYSGNGGFGNIYSAGFGTVGFFNNYIGTNLQGNQAIPNHEVTALGIGNLLFGEGFIGAVGTDDSNAPISLGNLISGNSSGAISTSTFSSTFLGSGYFSPLTIQGNRIGTDASGILAIPNGDIANPQTAISISRGFTEPTLIGGANPLARNIISGNIGDGIDNFALPNFPTPVTITNNLIGVNSSLNPLGNGGSGIYVFRGFGIQIGGTDQEANQIAYNGSGFSNTAGIVVGLDATSIKIRNNSIHHNAGLGIDLGSTVFGGGDGVTINDTCDQDADLGANLLQNFPELMTPIFNGDGTVTVEGVLHSVGRQHFTIEFFASSSPSSSNHGEGETPIGSIGVNTDGNGFASFTFTSTAVVTASSVISSTTTDDFGNTSEFSCNAGADCSPLTPFHNLREYLASPKESCPAALVVNRAGDESDQNPNDGVCDIDTNTDGLQCTLRAALEVITRAGYVGTHTITFDIPGVGVHTITPATPLPDITTQVHIQADSQPGFSDFPLIELSGAAHGDTHGLFFAPGSDGSSLRGMTINRFSGSGVILRSNNNTVELCAIGPNSDGLHFDPNARQRVGIQVIGSGNTIGGSVETSLNIITGNVENQILITGDSATRNQVYGNAIGYFRDLSADSGLYSGVRIESGASLNTIGGPDQKQRNSIIGAEHAGIEIIDGAHDNNAYTNTVLLGYIGIAVVRSSGNRIGNGEGNNGFFSVGTAGNFLGIYIADETPDYPTSLPLPNSAELFKRLKELKPAVASPESAATHDNRIQNCLIASNGDSTGNYVGIHVGTAFKTTIGRSNSSETQPTNVVSGNDNFGIFLTSVSSQTTVWGNTIGLDPSDRTQPRPNKVGIFIQGKANTIRNNTISGNSETGIALVQVSETVFPEQNKIFSNCIGNNCGNLAIPNEIQGIVVEGSNNDIGLLGQGNIISGNGACGVQINDDGLVNRVTGNVIGIDPNSNPVGNDAGVCVYGFGNRVVNNTISGNRTEGVILARETTHSSGGHGNLIIGNKIGTNIDGDAAVPNAFDGVRVTQGGFNNIIGGLGPGEGNLISGNGDAGIYIGLVDGSTVAPFGNEVFGNRIGTNANGDGEIANGKAGIAIFQSMGNTIGGSGPAIPAARNTISGNSWAGIIITGAQSIHNDVKGNYIGVGADGSTPVGNHGNGIYFAIGASNNTVGGTEPNAGNLIANNGRLGVAFAPDAGTGNTVDPNQITANAMGGIALNETADADDNSSPPPVPVANDPGDGDEGPNRLQNYPEFVSAVINSSGNLILQYKVDSDPSNSNYGASGLYIEFFKADALLQGQAFIGSTHYTADDYSNGSPGIATYDAGNAAALGVSNGDKIIATATDADGNTSEFTSVDIGIVGSPTAIKLASFIAHSDGDSVLLNWQTGLEVDNLGFNIYREIDGKRTLITPQLVAGSALSDGPGTSLLSGHNYYWADTPPPGKSIRYWLEDIDLNGRSTMNGPFSISADSSASPSEMQRRSALLAQIGQRAGLFANGLGSAPLARAATISPASDPTLELQSGLARQSTAVKITVRQEAYYRITKQELLRAGLDLKADPRLLQLYVDGVEQPIKVTGEQDGRFDANDAIEFYGESLDTASTDARVYWLVSGTKPGKRIPFTQSKGAPLNSSGFPFTVERRDRTIYFAGLRNGDTENFFGAVVASQPVDQTLQLQHVDTSSIVPATIDVSLQGVTQTAHIVRVQLNGAEVTRLEFTGQGLGSQRVSVYPTLLHEGENTVRLIVEGGPSDVSLVDAIRITYSHLFHADSDRLRVVTIAGQQIRAAGFSSPNIRVIDITDAGMVQEIAATVSEDKSGYSVSATPSGNGERSLLIFADSQTSHPEKIAANIPSSLRQTGNGADMLILSSRNFFDAIEPLKIQRQKQGLSVAVIDIDDIYDEFSFGNKSPQAVKDFLGYAASNWKKLPRFVLLAGEASYDPRNYLGLGDLDVVPTRLIDTQNMQTASDDWLADFNNDGIPEMAVGRLPFRNSGEAVRMIQKIIGYDQSRTSEEVSLVSDVGDGFDFEQASSQLVDVIPSSLKVNQLDRGGLGTSTAKERLLEAVNRGQKIVNYAGHGSENQWRGNLLENEDAALMSNQDRLSLFVMMTCLNGYFDDPAMESLAESLLKAEHGGAVAVWASSGITMPGAHAAINRQLYVSLLGQGARLGEATKAAKAATNDIDVRRTWILIGDPTMRLR